MCRWSRPSPTPTPLDDHRRRARRSRFAYRTDFVANTYQVQPRVELEDSEIVFVGYGINAPERGWNDYAGVDVRGKTVVILVNDPDWQTHGSRRPVQRPGDDLLRPLDLQI